MRLADLQDLLTDGGSTLNNFASGGPNFSFGSSLTDALDGVNLTACFLGLIPGTCLADSDTLNLPGDIGGAGITG